MLWKEDTPVSVELLLRARQCPCPYCRLAPFPCFFVPEDEGSYYHEFSLLARPGGLWTPNCWSGTLLHIEALRILSASSSMSENCLLPGTQHHRDAHGSP